MPDFIPSRTFGSTSSRTRASASSSVIVRRREVDAHRAVAVDAHQLRGPTVWRGSTGLTDRLHARRGGDDRQFGQLLGGAPFARLDDDVHALVAVEILARPESAGKGTHARGDFRARQAGPRDAPLIGMSCNSGWLSSSDGNGCGYVSWMAFWNLIHGNSRCVHQRHQVRTLEIEPDLAVVAAVHVEQRPALRKTGVSGSPANRSSRSRETMSWISRGSLG